MELRHLRYFTAVAEHLNYLEASRRIHVAQPAISQTILDLEEELGVRLLLRDRRTVRLSEERACGTVTYTRRREVAAMRKSGVPEPATYVPISVFRAVTVPSNGARIILNASSASMLSTLRCSAATTA